jgi:plastocyanin
MTRKPIATALAAMTAAGVLVPVVADGATKRKPQKKTVTMNDNFYGPAKLTINAGSTVTWQWPVEVGDSHDVKLTKKPSGARFTYVDEDTGKKVTRTTFTSPPFAAGPAKFKVTGFTKPGKYHLICTFHETEMTMDITVRK